MQGISALPRISPRGRGHNPGTELSNSLSFGIRSSKGSVPLEGKEGAAADGLHKDVFLRIKGME